MSVRRFGLLALWLAGCGASLSAQEAPVVVYLVRHAERGDDGTSDPPLTAAGRARALLLADMLRDAAITHIHTTDYLRTRTTAAALVERTGSSETLYGARELSILADRLRATPGRHLVVGHSDTTPQLVGLLGGESGPPIADGEYDRLYMLTLTSTGTSTVLLRYGEPYRPSP